MKRSGLFAKLMKKIGGIYMSNTVISLSIFLLFLLSSHSIAKDVPFSLEDRDRLIKIEARLTEIDKRFESIDKRFESVDKRFESLERQIDRQSLIFTALVVAVIGFALWDRRTMIRPFEDKVKDLNNRLDVHERAIKDMDEQKVSKLIEAFRDLAVNDSKVAGVLKKFNLL